MKEITLDATPENIGVATDFVEEFLDEIGCPIKAKMKLNIAIDELFGNIANYAYPDGAGNCQGGGAGKSKSSLHYLHRQRRAIQSPVKGGS